MIIIKIDNQSTMVDECDKAIIYLRYVDARPRTKKTRKFMYVLKV